MEITEDELKDLYQERHEYLQLKAKFSGLVGPRLFDLSKESNNNLRNLIVISGTIVPFSLLLLDRNLANQDLLKITISLLLLVVFFGTLILKELITISIKSHQEILDINNNKVDEMLAILDKRIHAKITKDEYDKQKLNFLQEINETKLRPNNSEEIEKKRQDKNKEKLLDNFTMSIFLLFLIAAFLLIMAIWL